jgi:AcrR family transcriptional regulator
VARRRLDPAERRGELLEQALLEFARRPYDEVTVADIAARAGASEGLVFRYFADKRELYVEAIGAGLERAGDVVDPGDPTMPPTERFEVGLAAFLDLVEDFPYLIPHLLQGGPAADLELQRRVAETYELVADRIIDRMGVADPPDELRWAIRTWLGFVQFTAAQWLEAEGPSREALMRTQIATFRAIAAEALGIDPTPSEPGSPPPLLP